MLAALLLCLAPVPPDALPGVGPGTRFETLGVVVEVHATDERCPRWRPKPGCWCLWNVTHGCWLTRHPAHAGCVWSWTHAEIYGAVRTGALP
jgi:hypothetical protein